MKTTQRIAFSILLMVIVGGAATFAAFSGLFEYVDVRFYQSRLKQQIIGELDGLKAGVRGFDKNLFLQFSSLIDKPLIQRNFVPNQSQEDILGTEAEFLRMKREVPGFLFARLVDLKGEIHYSTLEDDLKSDGRYRKVYRNLSESGGTLEVEELSLVDGVKVLNEPTNQMILYLLPIQDTFVGERIGTAIFYVSGRGLRQFLIKEGYINLGDELELLWEGSLVNRANSFDLTNFREAIGGLWAENSEESFFPLGKEDGGDNSIFLVSGIVDDHRKIGTLIFGHTLSLSEPMKYFLLLTFYFTLFLVLLLVLSFSQDKALVASHRIKRFQINFLKEYVENREDLDWEAWKREGLAQKEIINRQIKKGLGRLAGDKSREVDELLEKSWEDIFRILGKKAAASAATPNLEHIESLLKKVLRDPENLIGTRQSVEHDPSGTIPAKISGAAEAAEESPPKGDDVLRGEDSDEAEDLAETKVLEVEEASGEAETLDEAEPLDEVESLDEAEPLDEVESLDEAESFEEVESLDEAESLNEVESLDEAESLDEVESLEEAESLDEVESLDEAELLDEMESLDEAKPLDEVESLDEAELLDEMESLDEAKPLDEMESLDEAKPLDEMESLDEAEPSDEAGAQQNVSDDSSFPFGDSLELMLESYDEEVLRDMEEALVEEGEQGPIDVFNNIEDVKDSINVKPLEAPGLSQNLDAPEGESADESTTLELSETAKEQEILSSAASTLPPLSSDSKEEEKPITESGQEHWSEDRLEAKFWRTGLLKKIVARQEYYQPSSGEKKSEEPSISGGTRSVKDLLAKNGEEGNIELMSVTDFSPLSEEESISFEDGVYKIREKIYQTDPPMKDDTLGELAKSVMEDKEEALEPSDSQPPFSREEGGEAVPALSPSFLSTGGVNFDYLKEKLPEDSTEDDQLLMRLGALVDAPMGALLVEEEASLGIVSSVGMDGGSCEKITFKKEEEVYQEIFENRKILLQKSLKTQIEDLDRRIPDEFHNVLSGLIYIPVVTENRNGYVILGLIENDKNILYYMNLIYNFFKQPESKLR